MFCLLFLEFKDGCYDYEVFSDFENTNALERALIYVKSLNLSELDYFQVRFISEAQYNHYKFLI